MESTNYNFNDGGRAKAGFKGKTGDCGVRALAICLDIPYEDVYYKAKEFCRLEKPSKRRRGKSNPRTGIHTDTYKKICDYYGLKWIPTMSIGSGTKVHLKEDELPKGRIICRVSRHYTAVIDGVINDTYDPSRDGNRAVYGYWINENEIKTQTQTQTDMDSVNFKWNNSLVKMFTQIYSGNFNSKLIDQTIFSWSDYHGKPMDEKLKQFRNDCSKLPMFKADI